MTQSTRTKRIIGWILTAPVAGMLAFSAVGKLAGLEPATMGAAGMGFTEYLILFGLIEIGVVLAFISPLTVVGLVLVSAYLGGAAVAHLTSGAIPQPVKTEIDMTSAVVPFGLLALAWIAAYLRDPAAVFGLRASKKA